MTITSAHPDRLDQFVVRTHTLHRNADDERRSLAAFASGVRSRSLDFGIDSPSIGAVDQLLAAMNSTDRFVEVIRDELLAADGAAVQGRVTVDDAHLAAALDRAGVGQAPAPVEFEPATMFGLPPTSGFVDDPICAANGNMIHQDLDLQFAGVASALELRRTYNSLLSDRSGAFGVGVSSIFDVVLHTGPGRVEVCLPDGATAAFVRTPTGWASAGRRLLDFSETDDGWVVRTDPRHSYRFDRAGRLTGWAAGTARVSVQRDSFDRIVTVREHRTGRSIHADWADDRVSQVATDDGREVTYTYDHLGGNAQLVRAASASGALVYEWDDGFLVSVVDPDGVRPFVNTYDADGRVVRQRSPFGRVTDYRYDGSGLTVITDASGTRQAMVHDQRGNLTAVIDVDGSAMRLTYDHADRVTKVVDRDGATWTYEFDADSGELVGRVDPDGLSMAWTWDGHGRVTSQTDRAGNATRYEYPADAELTTPVRVVRVDGAATLVDVDPTLDRPLMVTDPDGVAVHYEYDRDGQLVAMVDALGRRTSLDYDEAGRLLRRVDPIGAVTELSYDVTGRLVRFDRDGDVGTFTYTRAGRVVAGTEPGGAAWSAEFGEHGAPVAVTDPVGNSTRFAHDELGNIVAITTADGATYHRFHDEIGRPVGSADPSGATAHLRYDIAGRVVEATDAADRTYRRDVDALGRTIRSIGPDGAVTTWTYHPTGEIATVTLPDGRTWVSAIDPAGRVVAVTDPAGRVARSTYTAAGRLVERRSPAGRVENFEYDAAGQMAAIVSIDGTRHEFERDAAGRMTAATRGDVRDEFERDLHGRVVGHRTFDATGIEVRGTSLEHDAAGRLTARVDGVGVRTTFDWDARGLLATATDASGGVLEYRYDARGRLVAQTAPGGRTTTFGYDVAGRLNEIVDPAGVLTSFEFDPSGIEVGQRTGEHGTRSILDAAGREVGRTDLDGDLLAEFGYDAAGRLVTAIRGVHAEEFLWDDNDFLVGTTAPRGSTRIERDADGWTIGLVQPDGTHLSIERDLAGRIAEVAGFSTDDASALPRDLAGRLLLGRDGSAYHYDDAGRLARIETPDGTDTRFDYDEDGLIAAEHGPHGTRRFRYDDAGRVAEISVTIDGDVEGATTLSTTYAYDDAGRRIGETRSDGSSYAFEWEGLGRLTAIVHVDAAGSRRIPIESDALGRPVRIGEMEIAYDTISGLPSQLGDVAVVNTANGAWRSDTGYLHAPGIAPTGLRIGGLTFLGARVHDAATHQFLSPDPLLPAPGSAGSASAYTYAWHDPVNHVDPSGKRPISLEEWDAIRTREEQGRVGQMVQAVVDDPWGTALMVGVVAVGVALTASGVGTAVGAGILVGVGISAGLGVATGTFDPMDVAIGGAFGAVGGGLAQGVRAAAISTRAGIAAHGALGTSEQLVAQARSGQGFDLRQGLAAGFVNAASFGIGDKVNPQSYLSGALTGAATDGGLSVSEQVLTGQPIDLGAAALDASFGATGGSVDVLLDRLHASQVRADALEVAHGPTVVGGDTTRVYRVVGSAAEQTIYDETGVVLSDAAGLSVRGINDVVGGTSSSVDHHDSAVAEWFGDQTDYAAAQAEWDGEIETVSGERTLIELTTDVDVAARAAAGGNTVLTAEVPTDRLVTQYQDGSVFTPHIIEMEPMSSVRP